MNSQKVKFSCILLVGEDVLICDVAHHRAEYVEVFRMYNATEGGTR